ncbi:MAG: hypothetical protein JSS02_05890 [Planctomycetes bacterium]|nr:hypothetical protein [Planctomycetota bacterium]
MKLNLERCFSDAWSVFARNWLLLMVAGLLFSAVSAVTAFILAGPMLTGLVFLSLQALRREDHVADLSDLFVPFDRFWSTVGLFFLTLSGVLVGLSLCLAPGLYLMVVWMFPFYILADQRVGIGEALSKGQQIVWAAGFWNISLLALTTLVLELLPHFVPVAGTVVSFATGPFATLVAGAAYLQLTEHSPAAATAEAAEAGPQPA